MIGLAKKIGCRSLISGSGNKVPGLGREKALDSMVEGLSRLAPVCRANGITLIVEPFNSRVDHPDYFLDDPETCVEVLRQVNSPNVKMLFDIYHMQIMYGNILSFVPAEPPAHRAFPRRRRPRAARADPERARLCLHPEADRRDGIHGVLRPGVLADGGRRGSPCRTSAY